MTAPRTNPAGTETSEGYIPHLEVFTDHGIIHAPVKLRTESGAVVTNWTDGGYRFAVPLRRDGALVFALPGGGEYVG